MESSHPPFSIFHARIGSHRHDKMSKYVHYRDKQMRVLCDVLTETQNQWGPEQSKHSGAPSRPPPPGSYQRKWVTKDRVVSHPPCDGAGAGHGGRWLWNASEFKTFSAVDWGCELGGWREQRPFVLFYRETILWCALSSGGHDCYFLLYSTAQITLHSLLAQTFLCWCRAGTALCVLAGHHWRQWHWETFNKAKPNKHTNNRP